MSTGKGWEGDDCTCGGENSRWRGLQARAHREPLSPAEEWLLLVPTPREGPVGVGGDPPLPRVRMPLHKAEGLRADKACSKRVSKRPFWGLPCHSSGLRLGAS